MSVVKSPVSPKKNRCLVLESGTPATPLVAPVALLAADLLATPAVALTTSPAHTQARDLAIVAARGTTAQISLENRLVDRRL